MAIPNLFHGLSTATGAMLDANFAAVGNFLPIGCSTVGAGGTLILTPLGGAPAVTGYVNYQQFSGIANGPNSGTVNAQVAGFALLNVFKDGPTGPVAMAGGELQTGNAFTLMYDGTLDGGLGGFHFQATQAIAGDYLPLTGGTLTGALLGTSISASVISGSASITAPLGVLNTIASVSSLKWFTGVSITSLLASTTSLSALLVTPNSATDQVLLVPGCSVGDMTMVSTPVDLAANTLLTSWVSGAGSVTLRFGNPTAASISTPAGAYRAVAMRI